MKALLLILRYLLTWITPVPVNYYLGLGLLPVVFVTGFFWPRVAFGLAVWSFLFLLAIPFFSLPTALRTLLSNHRLMIMRGFASKIILSLFLYVLLFAMFLPFFAWFYDIARFPSNAGFYIFPLVSIYLFIAFVATRLPWGLQLLGILLAPIVVLGSQWLKRHGELPGFSTEQFYTLTGAVLLGWGFVFQWATKLRHVRPPNQHCFEQPQQIFNMGSLPGAGLWFANNLTGSPALSLMLGYPANNLSVFGLKLFAGIFGPFSLVFFIWLADIGQEKFSGPKLIQMIMFMYLFSATFIGFQNNELVARLRLLWLKAPRLREDLWNMLETQHWLSQATFLLLTTTLAVVGSFMLTIKPLLLLHYPLLLFALHGHTSYYCICSRVRGWTAMTSFLLLTLIWVCSISITVHSISLESAAPIFMLELVLLGTAFTWRQLGKAQFARLDWQAVKPVQMRWGLGI